MNRKPDTQAQPEPETKEDQHDPAGPVEVVQTPVVEADPNNPLEVKREGLAVASGTSVDYQTPEPGVIVTD